MKGILGPCVNEATTVIYQEFRHKEMLKIINTEDFLKWGESLDFDALFKQINILFIEL